MRYNKLKTRTSPSGERYLETPTLTRVPISENDIYIEVTTTDRLDLISFNYYGTPEFWWLIANANGIGKGTMYVKEGAILRMPSTTTGVSSYNNEMGY